MYSDAMGMRKCNAFFHIFVAEILRLCTQGKCLSADIYRIRTKDNCCFNTSRLLAGINNSGFLILLILLYRKRNPISEWYDRSHKRFVVFSSYKYSRILVWIVRFLLATA